MVRIVRIRFGLAINSRNLFFWLILAYFFSICNDI